MNDFATPETYAIAATGVETSSTAAAAQAKALVEARYIIAIRRPRDMDAVRERMLKECRRPSFAAVARYVKPIGKDKAKWPTGPSIRFIESAIRNMTNVTVETMTLYDDREKRIVRVTVTDLESNVPYSQDIPIAKTIERRAKKEGDVVLRERTNSYGDKLYIMEGTDDDIMTKQAALISKFIRTLGQRLIPGDIVDECMELILETQRNADAQDPNAAKRKLFDSFGSLGVRVDQIKEYLGHDGETLSPKELQELRALYSAIRDGEATWRDVMDERAAPAKAAKGLEAVKEAIKPRAMAVDPKTGEITSDNPETGSDLLSPMSHAQVAELLTRAATPDTLDHARAQIPRVASEAHRAELNAIATKRFAEISAALDKAAG